MSRNAVNKSELGIGLLYRYESITTAIFKRLCYLVLLIANVTNLAHPIVRHFKHVVYLLHSRGKVGIGHTYLLCLANLYIIVNDNAKAVLAFWVIYL